MTKVVTKTFSKNPAAFVCCCVSNAPGRGLPCVTCRRTGRRRRRAVADALRAMPKLPKLIRINQAESMEGSEGRQWRRRLSARRCGRVCVTAKAMAYLHRKPHTHWGKARASQQRVIACGEHLLLESWFTVSANLLQCSLFVFVRSKGERLIWS